MSSAATYADPPSDSLLTIYPPGPRLPAAVLLAEYWFAPGRFIERCSRLGDRFTLHLPGVGKLLCLTNPEDLRRLFTAAPDVLEVASVINRILPATVFFGEESILESEGERHVAERRRFAPPLHGEALKSYEPAMVAKTEEAVATWPYGEEICLKERIAPLALEIIMGVVFGVTDRQRLDRLRAHTLSFLATLESRRFRLQTVWGIARGGKWTGGYDYIRDARARVDAVLLEEIRERRQRHDRSRSDILAGLLQIRDEQGHPLSDRYLLNTLAALLLAGFETTATTIAWLGSEVSRSADVIDRLEQAAREGDDGYIDAVIMETLRLRTPGIFTLRLVAKPFALDDRLVLAPGTLLAPCLALVHLRPDLYPHPRRFDPKRFVAERPDPYRWVPFGGGRGAVSALHSRCSRCGPSCARCSAGPASAWPPRPPRSTAGRWA